MKKLCVAITNSYNDTITMLPPAFVIGDTLVLIHDNPRMEFRNNYYEFIKNFDFHIDFNLKPNKLHMETLNSVLPNKAYFHYPRVSRTTQAINVYKFNMENKSKMFLWTPPFYTATQREGEHVTITNFGIPKKDSKLVIKTQFGARGSNQILVPANMVTTLFKHGMGLSYRELKEMFPDLIFSESTNLDTVFCENTEDAFVSELIKVRKEWRLLVSGKDIYARKRVINQGPYPQANMELNKFSTVPTVEYAKIEKVFYQNEELCNTLHEFVKFIDLPIGSIDLYMDEHGQYGIFEYSTQFAFHGADPQFIRDLLINGIAHILGVQDVENLKKVY